MILAAIGLSEPDLPNDQAHAIATALQEEAKAHDFDPLTGVAIITHESGFRADAISRSGEDFGLAQIRARYIGACKKDPNPVKAPGKECKKVHAMLLDPVGNIRVMADLITQNRKFCKKKVGSARFERWLASYQGRNNARKKRWCHPGKGTWQVIQTRARLISQLTRRKLL